MQDRIKVEKNAFVYWRINMRSATLDILDHVALSIKTLQTWKVPPSCFLLAPGFLGTNQNTVLITFDWFLEENVYHTLTKFITWHMHLHITRPTVQNV